MDPTLEAKQRAVLHALEERRGCWAIHSSASSNTKTCTLPSASISNLANPSAISSAQAVMRASLRNSLMNVSNSVRTGAPTKRAVPQHVAHFIVRQSDDNLVDLTGR